MGFDVGRQRAADRARRRGAARSSALPRRRRRRLPRRPRADPRRHRVVGLPPRRPQGDRGAARTRSSCRTRRSRLTWDSLARIGNLSSASVLHVLADTLRDRPPRPGLLRRADGDGARLLLRAGAAARRGSASMTAPGRVHRRWSSWSALERLAELVVSKRNAAWSLERGGRETGHGHYPVMVVLHTGLLVGALVEAWVRRPDVPGRAGLVDAGAGRSPRQALRWWCIATLGRRWNTRVIVVPGPGAGATAVPTGCSRHPNYVAVVVEGVALPLVHAAWITALVFTRAQRGAADRADPGRERRARAPCRVDEGRPMRDLVVAGGGPVGLATALYAARAGLDVVVREPRAGADRQGLRRGADARRRRRPRRPRRRAATGTRSPASATSTAAARGRGAVPARRRPRRPPYRRCTRRCPTAVADAGVKVEHARGAARSRTAATTCSSTASPPGYLVAADGLHSPVRRMLGLDGPAARPPPVRAARATSTVAPWTAFVEVHWAAAGEAYVTPVADDLVGVAVLDRAQRGRSTSCSASIPALRRAARRRGPLPGSAAPARCGSAPRARVAGRVLLVGDAAGYVDALTGEGIALGLAQARAAVDAVRAGDARALRARPGAGSAGGTTCSPTACSPRPGRPCVRRRIVPPRPRLPRVFAAAVNQLARPA